MAWIKRNILFAIVAILALGLLGGAGLLIYKGLSRNSEASDKLAQIYSDIKNLNAQLPAPGNEKVNNITLAKQQEVELRNWLVASGKSFQSIPPIPSDKPVASEYASALRKTIDTLQRRADASGVLLPPKYDFSFGAEKDRVTFAPKSLEPLAVQLGEVRAIIEILYASRINALIGIQRVRVSEDDIAGPQSDYLDLHPVTNDLAIITPYVVTLRCFTPELARAVAGFATSSQAFIVKYINVQPANAMASAGGGEGIPVGYGIPQPVAGYGRFAPPSPVQPNSPVSAGGKGGPQTVLKEQLLQITLEVELVKLLPKS
jgi:hypothetical protein